MHSLIKRRLFGIAASVFLGLAFASTAWCVAPPGYTVTKTTGVALVPGTTDTGLHADDDRLSIPLPFSVSFYDQTFNTVNLSPNGWVSFSGNTTTTGFCLPNSFENNIVATFAKDLVTNDSNNGEGVFTSITGSSPNRVFNIEWRTRQCCQTGLPTSHFEMRLYEGQQRIDFVYGNVEVNGVNNTIGIQRDTGSQTTVVTSCTLRFPAAGTQYSFTEMTISAPDFLAATGANYSSDVASFTTTRSGAAAGDFTTTIDWGDGSPSSTGTVTGSGTFTVAGSHTYAAAGAYPVSIKVTDTTDTHANVGTATANVAASAAAECLPAPAGLANWWPGDNDALDLAGGANGTMQGATFGTGEVNQAFSFNGTSQYVDVGVVPLQGTFTIDAWINPTAPFTSGNHHILTKAGDSIGVDDYFFTIDANGIVQGFVQEAGGGAYTNYATGAGAVVAGTWQHVVMTYDGDAGAGEKMKFYVNGINVPATPVQPSGFDAGGTPQNSSGTTTKIGIIGQNNLQEAFKGLIDEVEVFNRVLSPSEALSLYNAGAHGKCHPQCVAPPSGLLNWYTADGNAKDSAAGNDGTVYSGVSFVAGEVGEAFSFAANQAQYVDIGNVNLPDTFTIDAWVNPTSTNTGRVIIGNRDSANGFFLRVLGGALLATKLNASVETTYQTANGVIPDNVWTHVAAVYDASAAIGQRFQLYINGVAIGATPVLDGGGSVGVSSLTCKIGYANGFANPWDGSIDEVEIFGHALSDSEVLAIHNSYTAGKCRTSCAAPVSGLVGWWSGDNTAVDLQVAHNGTLENGAAFANGKVGRAFSFTDANQDVDLGSIDLPTNKLSFVGWIYTASINGFFQTILSNLDATNNGYVLDVTPDGRVDAFVGNANTGFTEYQTPANTVVPGIWQHVAVTYDGSLGSHLKFKFYINGALIPSGSINAQSENNVTPGQSGVTAKIAPDTVNGNHFLGVIDELQVYNRTLSTSDVQSIYNGGAAGTCKSFLLYAANNGTSTIEKFDGSAADLATFADTSSTSALQSPFGITLDMSGNLYVSVISPSGKILKFDPLGGGNVFVTSGAGLSNNPFGLAFSPSGVLYIADSGVSALKKCTPPDATVSTVSTTGLSQPTDVTVGPDGNVYVANTNSVNKTVRGFQADGTDLGVVGTLSDTPSGLRFDTSGRLYVATSSGSCPIETFQLPATDTGLFIQAASNKYGIEFDPNGNLYITQNNGVNPAIFKIDPSANKTLFTGSSNLSIPDYIAIRQLSPTATLLQFNRASYEVNETVGNVTVTVTRGGDTSNPSSVHYSTTGGSAQDGTDFTGVSGTLNFGGGDKTPKTFNIPIIHRSGVQGQRSFTVTLDTPTNGVLDGPVTSTILIDEADAVVTNTAGDSTTPGSLLYELQNDVQNGGTLTFNFPDQGPHTIALTNDELGIFQSVNIVGPSDGSLTVVAAPGKSRLFDITQNVTVTISNLKMTHAFPAILNSGSLTLTNCTLSDNGDSSVIVGAIQNEGSSANASLIVVNCTLSNNSGIGAGAIRNSSANGHTASALVINSTLSYNTCNSGNASAIYNVSNAVGSPAILRIFNSTLSQNFNLSGGSTPMIENDGTSASLTIGSTILNGYPGMPTIGNAAGSPLSSGYNIATDNSAILTATGDIKNTDPMITALRDNGGPSLTHALLPGSPALDKGFNFAGDSNNTNYTALTADQRGLSRAVTFSSSISPPTNGDRTDVGAVEMVPNTIKFALATQNVGEGAGNAVVALKRTAGSDAVTAKVTIGNGSASASDYTLPPPGVLDTGFNAAGAGPDNTVYAVAVQPDGKIVTGGVFTTYNGDAAASDYVMRLNADGTRDTGFNTAGVGANSTVYAVAVQPDGKIVIVGSFINYNGDAAASDFVMRLNADGTRDLTFNAGGTGANDIVYCVALQPDGKIVIGGGTSYDGDAAASDYVMRLNGDGTRDTTFNNGGAGANSGVFALAIEPDGKIVIGGNFVSYNGNAAGRLARLNADGTRDTTFNAGGSGADGTVLALAIESDGKIVIGGNFTSYNGDAVGGIARLNSDGTRDTTFNAGSAGANGLVHAVAVQPDGRVVIGGDFTTYNGNAAGRIARLNGDGTRDTTFNAGGAGANSTAYAVAVQPEGKVVLGGSFTTYNGGAAARITRLAGDLFVTWAAGDTSDQIITLPIVQDLLEEGNETVVFGLVPLTAGSLGTTPTSNTLTIVNDDAAPAFVNDSPSGGTVSQSYSYAFTASGEANGSSTVTFSLSILSSPLPDGLSLASDGTLSGTPTAAGTFSNIRVVASNGVAPDATTAPLSIAIAKANQTINFAALPDKTVGDPDFSVSATATSGLPVSFAATPSSVCTNSGATIHIVGAGTCTVTASQSGNSNYNAAIPVARTFTVNPAPTPTPTPTTTPTPTATATTTASPTATATATPTPTPTPATAEPLNISTRMEVLSGENVLIAGFIITGEPGATKKVMIRGLGPSLAAAGVPNPLADPVLELHGPAGFSTVVNDNWQEASNTSDIPDGFQPTDPRESVIIATLTIGPEGFANYTAIVRGAHGEHGIGLAEAYDLEAGTNQFANISTRGFIDTGDNVMIGGFILGGSDAGTKVLIRGIGASLGDQGVTGVLADPTLEIHDADGNKIRSNDNWKIDDATGQSQQAAIEATTIPPASDFESAVLDTFPPGRYTAIVAGKDQGTGVGLVEAYNLRE